MSNLNKGVGLHHVPSFQTSGYPWITGSSLSAAELKIEFPSVAREFTVIKNDSHHTLRIHFNSTASANTISGLHYIELSNTGDSYSFRCKVQDLWLSNPHSGSATAFTVAAELTNIPRSSRFILTGSGIDE